MTGEKLSERFKSSLLLLLCGDTKPSNKSLKSSVFKCIVFLYKRFEIVFFGLPI